MAQLLDTLHHHVELSDSPTLWQPGHRVLEIGAATGINAALLQGLVGAAAHVTIIDIDPDLVEGARRSLSAAGYDQVD